MANTPPHCLHSLSVLLLLILSASCTRPSAELVGRPCSDDGRCMNGYSCHPETRRCSPAILVGCDNGGICPSSTFTGDACSPVGAWLPCSDQTTDCSEGCRSCLSDGTWSDCTTPDCVLGEVWSCSSCSDNCRTQVANAVPECLTTPSGEYFCGYAECSAGYADADSDPLNGCECKTDTGGIEICDLADNNCDGRIDEGFDVGSSCGVGICAGGVMVCDPDFAGSRCTTMPGGSNDRSQLEVCDTLDNDCDGTVDEDFALGGECGVGACAGGIEVCAPDGTEASCTTMPGGTNDQSSPELCDSIDNDCDDQVDEAYPEDGQRCDGEDSDFCADGFVICRQGALSCDDGEDLGGENCNGQDDDCNGQIDDGLIRPPANNQAGVCSGQLQSCGGHQGWLEPNYALIASYEASEVTCDGLDNDCNGHVDDDLDAPLSATQAGVCQGLTQECRGAGGWAEPDYAAVPHYQEVETLCDGLDNDCDDARDEGFEIGFSCGSGACTGGEWECQANQNSRICSTQAGGSNDQTSSEICDAIDNDCDGENNEGLPVIPCDIGIGPGSGQKTCTSTDTSYSACTPLWKRRIQITLTPPQLFANVNQPTVLVELNSDRVNYSHIQSEGAHLRFLAFNHEAILPHEVMSWDATGTSSIWVTLPNISPGQPMSFWMYYDFQGIQSPAQEATAWPAPYLGVYHLEESTAGIGNQHAYLDSSPNGFDATDNVGAPSSGGHSGLGVDLDSGDEIVFPVTPSSDYTIELLYQSSLQHWSDSELIQITSPENFINDSNAVATTYQLEVKLDLASSYDAVPPPSQNDIRFTLPDGTMLDHWVESWNPQGSAVIWVSIPSSSDSELSIPESIYLFYGNPHATALSDFTNVLFNGGLWQSAWSDVSFNHPYNFSQMSSLINSFGYDGTANGVPLGNDFDSRHAALGVRCYSNCTGTNNLAKTVVALEGWLNIPETGDYTIAVNSDDASDLFIGGLAWKNQADNTYRSGYWYGAHGYQNKNRPQDWTHTFNTPLTAGLQRFVFRVENISGGYGWGAGWKVPGGNKVRYIEGSSFYYRMRYREEASHLMQSALRHEITLQGPWGRNLTVSPHSISASQDSSVATTNFQDSAWQYVALVVESNALTLYLNGIPQSVATEPLSVGASDFILRESGRGTLGNLGAIDEIRFSEGARSPDWIALQSASLNKTLLTYQAPQLVAP